MKTEKARKPRVAVIGECLIELNGKLFGEMRQTFGGDTLNTALYLARVAGGRIGVSYITAMGADVLSDAVVRRWEDEGIDTAHVLRDPARLPGLYLIQLDDTGERSFTYWRGESAARFLLQHKDFPGVETALPGFDMIYLSGISLAILPEPDRKKLAAFLKQCAAQGVAIAFDTNYRPKLWSSPAAAAAQFADLMPSLTLMLTSFADEEMLWNDASPEAALTRLHRMGVKIPVVKLGAAGVLFRDGDTMAKITPPPVPRVVDTTAAGDAFNAGFIAAWLRGQDVAESCRFGNRVAGAVVQHPGAIIPKAVTPTLSDFLSHHLEVP
jgi:2-dehydro-3-deoxygluconokinase